MIAATRTATPAQRCAGGRYARLDEEFLIEVRPYLTDGEARVYELLVLKNDGWKKPTNASAIAALAKIHPDTVRRVIRRLEEIGLIRSHWTGLPRSPTAERTIEIVRDYGRARTVLRQTAEGCPAEPSHRIDGSPDMGSPDPISGDRRIPSLLIARSQTRSDPDLPSLPSLPAPVPTEVEARPAEMEGRRKELGPGLVKSRVGGSEAPNTEPEMGTEASHPASVDSVAAVSRSPSSPGESEPEPRRAETAPSEDPGGAASPELGEAATAATGTPAAVRSGRPALATTNPLPKSSPEKPIADSPGHPALATTRPEPEGAADKGTSRNSEHPPLATTGPEPEISPAVPDELVTLARGLWGMNVAIKAARRYVNRLLTIGEPIATAEEIARYMRTSANLPRVQRAVFPLSVVCVPEEFASWLVRYRKLRVLPSTAPPLTTSRPSSTALSQTELGRRAQEFCAQLARGLTREGPSPCPATVEPPKNKGVDA